MLQRLDTPALSLPTVGVNTGNIYAISLFSYGDYKNGLKINQQPNNRLLHRQSSQSTELEASTFSHSITLDDDSWSDCTYSSASSSDSGYSLSISPSTLINATFEKSSSNTSDNKNNQINHANIMFPAAFENHYAGRRNENDARITIDSVTQDEDGLTDDEMTLFGDEMDMEMNDDDIDDNLYTPFTQCEFTKKEEIRLVNQKSLLSSMLLHSPPASASSSALSLYNASSSSFTNSCSSIITTTETNDVLSSSMKQYVHWEKIQNSGPGGRLVGFQKSSTTGAASTSTLLPIKNSFDTSTSCW